MLADSAGRRCAGALTARRHEFGNLTSNAHQLGLIALMTHCGTVRRQTHPEEMGVERPTRSPGQPSNTPFLIVAFIRPLRTQRSQWASEMKPPTIVP